MKTFLGFTTGLFSGTFIGMLLMATGIVASEDLREFANTLADGINNT